jgi:hypothetical protein
MHWAAAIEYLILGGGILVLGVAGIVSGNGIAVFGAVIFVPIGGGVMWIGIALLRGVRRGTSHGGQG